MLKMKLLDVLWLVFGSFLGVILTVILFIAAIILGFFTKNGFELSSETISIVGSHVFAVLGQLLTGEFSEFSKNYYGAFEEELGSMSKKGYFSAVGLLSLPFITFLFAPFFILEETTGLFTKSLVLFKTTWTKLRLPTNSFAIMLILIALIFVIMLVTR